MILRIMFLFGFTGFFYASYSQQPADTLLAKQYYLVGDSLKRISQYDNALLSYERAAEIYSSLKQWPGLAKSYAEIAENNIALSNYSKAKVYATRALSAWEKASANNPLIGAKVYSVLGDVSLYEADYHQSIEYLMKSLKILRKVLGDHHTAVADLYSKIARVYNFFGEYELSLEYTNKALPIFRDAFGDKHVSIGLMYEKYGAYYMGNENFEMALQSHKKALSIFKEALGENNITVANSYHQHGRSYKELKKYDEALTYYNKSLTILTKLTGGRHMIVMLLYRRIADVYHLKAENETAIAYYSKALTLSKDIFGDKHPGTASVYVNLGMLYSDTGQFDQALDCFQRSLIANVISFNSLEHSKLPGLDDCFDFVELLRSLQGKATAHERVYQKNKKTETLQLAIECYNLCDKVFDKMRQSHRSYADKLALAKESTLIYEHAIKNNLQLYEVTTDEKYLHNGFYFSERNKSGLLYEAISEISARNIGRIPTEVLSLESELKNTKSTYLSKIIHEKVQKNGYDTSKVNGYNAIVFDLSRKLDSLGLKIEHEYPAYYELKYSSNVSNIGAIQKMIQGDALFLEYFEGDSLIYIFSASKSKFSFHTCKKDSAFSQSLENFSQSVNGKLTNQFAGSAFYLYNVLVKPAVIAHPPVNQLIIVPDGSLAGIPFEALVQSMAARESGVKNFDYLIHHFNISYHYSMSLLAKNLNVHRVSGGFLGYAPFLPKSNLPHSEDEVKSSASLFNGQVVLGQLATEQNFKSNVLKYSMIHLATHAIINDDNPLNSELAFSVSNDTTEDGILHTYELYNLTINANLVTLSACNTGSGKFQKGEGVMSLARGFMYAGVPNMVMSLWKVSDEPTKDIMIFFYEEIKKGVPYATALRNAKIRFIKESDNVIASPFYWSSFVFVGDPEAANEDFTNWLWVIGLGFLSLVILWFFMRMLKK